MKDSITYKLAETALDYQRARTLFEAYHNNLDFTIDFQEFEKELQEIDKEYAPPEGVLLLALDGELPIGCIALRSLEKEIGEIKRMFVQPTHRGRAIGARLLELIIHRAQVLRYTKLRLDSLKRMKKAVQLYQSFGFFEIPSYRYNPLPDAIYLEKKLS